MSAQPQCIVCDGIEQRCIFRKRNRDYLRCTGCGLVVVHPLPGRDELEARYARDYEYAAGMGTIRVQAAEMMRASARSRMALVDRLAPGPRWLEVGSGCGAFLAEATRAGRDVEGLDLSRYAVDLLRRRGLVAHATTIEAFEPAEPYDVVVGFDVIEHARDPLAFVLAAHRLLRPGGLLVLTTPDTRSVSARVMRARWYHYIPETHLFHFDRGNLAAMLARAGFRVVRSARAYKSLSLAYSLLQFEAYNPLIHAVLRPASRVLPRTVRERPFPLPIGEFTTVAERASEAADVPLRAWIIELEPVVSALAAAASAC